jgi:hypothetical protein
VTGYYQMARGWQENRFFTTEPFTEREAWQWLIENAAWRPASARIKGVRVPIERGQLCFAQRFLAEKWQWSKSRVDRFLKRLVAENMISICSKIGATAGHPAGQGQSIITLCNYDKYQSPKDAERGNVEPEIGATAGQQRGKEEEEEEGEEERKGEDVARYAFFGRTIRLVPRDLEMWKDVYHAIPDLAALDAWFQEQDGKKRKAWFQTTSGALNRKHQEILERRSIEARGEGYDRDRITV